MPKLTLRQFYCVKCRKKVTSSADDICVKKYTNKKRKGGVHALRSQCNKCDTNLTKFVKNSQVEKLIEKFGKC